MKFRELSQMEGKKIGSLKKKVKKYKEKWERNVI